MDVIGLVVISMGALTLVVNAVFALGVLETARIDALNGRAPLFVGASGWASATLVFGPFMAGLYWLMQHSTLRYSPAESVEGTEWR